MPKLKKSIQRRAFKDEYAPLLGNEAHYWPLYARLPCSEATHPITGKLQRGVYVLGRSIFGIPLELITVWSHM